MRVWGRSQIIKFIRFLYVMRFFVFSIFGAFLSTWAQVLLRAFGPRLHFMRKIARFGTSGFFDPAP